MKLTKTPISYIASFYHTKQKTLEDGTALARPIQRITANIFDLAIIGLGTSFVIANLLRIMISAIFKDKNLFVTLEKAKFGLQLTAQESKILNSYTIISLGMSALNFCLMSMITIVCWTKWGYTPGKIVMGIRVVDTKTMLAPTLPKSIVRFLSSSLSFFPAMLGFLWASIDKQNRMFHDIIVKTVVIKTDVRTRIFIWVRNLVLNSEQKKDSEEGHIANIDNADSEKESENQDQELKQ